MDPVLNRVTVTAMSKATFFFFARSSSSPVSTYMYSLNRARFVSAPLPLCNHGGSSSDGNHDGSPSLTH